jgi:hypothetical protein
LVFGLQSSGKTTFAAALWHLLDSREVPTALAKGKHVGDFRYLEEIAQSWCEGWQVERTKMQQVEQVKINLLHPGSGTELVLEFADLSGEIFEEAFTTRLCPPIFVELVKDASGLLLFVSADRLLDDVTILDAFADEDVEQAGPEDDQGAKVPWDPAKTPQERGGRGGRPRLRRFRPRWATIEKGRTAGARPGAAPVAGPSQRAHQNRRHGRARA